MVIHTNIVTTTDPRFTSVASFSLLPVSAARKAVGSHAFSDLLNWTDYHTINRQHYNTHPLVTHTTHDKTSQWTWFVWVGGVWVRDSKARLRKSSCIKAGICGNERNDEFSALLTDIAWINHYKHSMHAHVVSSSSWSVAKTVAGSTRYVHFTENLDFIPQRPRHTPVPTWLLPDMVGVLQSCWRWPRKQLRWVAYSLLQ